MVLGPLGQPNVLPLTRRGRRGKVFERSSFKKSVAASSRHAEPEEFESP
jgi:hypothetical protein